MTQEFPEHSGGRAVGEQQGIDNCASARPLQDRAEALVKALMGLELD
ncbi:hypothetical protein [Micromonospora sp. NPDC005806]